MNKEREKKIKLLKALTNEQLTNELCRRNKRSPQDFRLVFIHKNAFYQTGESVSEVAEKVSKEAQAEAEQEALKDKLKQDLKN